MYLYLAKVGYFLKSANYISGLFLRHLNIQIQIKNGSMASTTPAVTSIAASHRIPVLLLILRLETGCTPKRG